MCGSELDARRALQDVFQSAGSAADGWWVLNTISVGVAQGNTDLDLLVGIPNVGLLIIEVKGWTSFEVDDYGKWSYPKARGRQEVGDGPYKQAEREEYLLLHLLSDLRGQQSLSNGDLPKVGSCVLFGNLDSSIAEMSAINKPRTLYRDTFCPTRTMTENDATTILQRLRSILTSQAQPVRSTSNTQSRLNEIRQLLSPLCSVRGLSIFLESSQIRIESLSEAALGERALAYEGNLLYVEGAAGTGKTCYALKLAVERSRGSGQLALFVCFSKRLAAEVRETPWLTSENVLIGTPEEILEHYGGQALLQDFLDQDIAATEAANQASALIGISVPTSLPRAYLESSKFAEALVAAVADSGVEFSAVLIDEAQDLYEPLLDGLSSLIDNQGLFAVFADPRQTTRRERSGLPWSKPSSLLNSDDQHLKMNYRNGDRIIDAVEHEFDINYGRPPRGAPPAEVLIETYRSVEEIPHLVSHVMEEMTTQGLNPVLLISGVQERELNALTSIGVEPIDVDEFKGLERKCVVLLLGPNPSPLDPNREDLYVGLTRATTYLIVIRRQK
jgi:hypothetical protein